MDFVDKQLTCVDCGAEFVFSAGEQLFFQDEAVYERPETL